MSLNGLFSNGKLPFLWYTIQMPNLPHSHLWSSQMQAISATTALLRLKVNNLLAVLEYTSLFCFQGQTTPPPRARSDCQLRAEPVYSSLPSTVFWTYLTLSWKVFGYPLLPFIFHFSFSLDKSKAQALPLWATSFLILNLSSFTTKKKMSYTEARKKLNTSGPLSPILACC